MEKKEFIEVMAQAVLNLSEVLVLIAKEINKQALDEQSKKDSDGCKPDLGL